MRMDTTQLISSAAQAIKKSRAILVTAGAGMGVDSGLPDFRGPEGLWKAYPPLRERNLTLPEMSTPRWFIDDPNFAWGFFGHRLQLYKRTDPHHGFSILKKWCDSKLRKGFVFTSNVDGHFQKAGFSEDSVYECHGSINFLQCVDSERNHTIWQAADDFQLEVREEDLHAEPPLPSGPPDVKDKMLARPNILMFGDWGFVDTRASIQEDNLQRWLSSVTEDDNIVVIEIGAGNYVPTVRHTSESISRSKKGTLIRINPREPEAPPKSSISLPLKGLEALEQIDAHL